jgi:hypothetical protein
MDPKNSVSSVGFQLNRVTTEQFAILPESYDKDNHETNLGIGLNFGVDNSKNAVAVFFKVQFEQQKGPFLIVEIANHFQIEDKAWESFCSDENKIVISKGFATHLLALTIGTARGVLHSKTENTEFNHFLLPTINATDLIQDDVELIISDNKD